MSPSRVATPAAARGTLPSPLYSRYVAVALIATALMLTAIPTVAALAHLAVSWPVIWACIGLTAVGSAIGGWMFRTAASRRRGEMVVLSLWSLLDVGAIGAVVATSGGERSWFWVVFALTTIFFSVGYPLRGQLAILAATLVTFALACASGSGPLDLVSLSWRLGFLVAVFGMASFPALELRRQAASHQAARSDADALAATLTRREAWWRSLIERMSDPILTFDRTWKVTFASPAFEALLGYSPAETAVLDLGVIVHPEDMDVVREASTRVRAGAAVRLTCRLQAKDGGWRDVEISLAEVEDAHERAFVVNLHDVTERVAAEAALTHQALHDSLTGLANRSAFHGALRRSLALGAGGSRPVSILMLDLENFKQVNDTIGHAAGDEVLTEVGKRLTGALAGAKIVARLGGDEFAAVLPLGISASQAMAAAHRVLEVLDEPVHLHGRPYWLRGNIGVACALGENTAADALMQRADRAMYEAKRMGVGVAFYDARMEGTDAARFSLLGELRRGIPAGELRLVYQPQVSPDLRVVGVEALVRWRHPTLGLIAPKTFLPVAEDSGLVRAITDWVVPTALFQVAGWMDAGRDVSVSVNVSAQDLAAEEFPARVEHWLHDAHVAPDRLTVELTEASAISDHDRGTGTLASLRALGVRVSLDDFGTGYSSLAYLAQLPLDEIKLDRGFVEAGLDTGSFLLRSVVDIGQHLGLFVVAEGVETGDVLDRVVSCGCDAVQGYVHARPEAPDDLVELLDRWQPDSKAERRRRAVGAGPIGRR